MVPAGLPTGNTDLDLEGNKISEIGGNNFTRVSSVIRMDLSRNRITHINDNAFLPCAALLDLRLKITR